MIGDFVNFCYETKCRRCGKLHTWLLKSVLNNEEKWKADWLYYSNLVGDFIKEPRQLYCEKNCDMDTIQDVVSYTPYGKFNEYNEQLQKDGITRSGA